MQAVKTQRNGGSAQAAPRRFLYKRPWKTKGSLCCIAVPAKFYAGTTAHCAENGSYARLWKTIRCLQAPWIPARRYLRRTCSRTTASLMSKSRYPRMRADAAHRNQPERLPVFCTLCRIPRERGILGRNLRPRGGVYSWGGVIPWGKKGAYRAESAPLSANNQNNSKHKEKEFQ